MTTTEIESRAKDAGLTLSLLILARDFDRLTPAALREELADRLALARHARRRGLRLARLWHIEVALKARRQLRAL